MPTRNAILAALVLGGAGGAILLAPDVTEGAGIFDSEAAAAAYVARCDDRLGLGQ